MKGASPARRAPDRRQADSSNDAIPFRYTLPVALRRKRTTEETSEEKPKYGFEASGGSIALLPMLFGLVPLLTNLGGRWSFVSIAILLYFGWSGITMVIGSTDWYRNGLNQLLVEASRVGRTSKTLNANCGTGSLAVAFGKSLSKGEVWATDQWKPTKRSPDPSQRTSDNIRIEGVENIVRLRDADPHELPFKAGYFGAVGSRYGIQNTRKGKTEALLEMLRVLRPTGRLVLAEGGFVALWLRYRILPRLVREYRVCNVHLSRFHFTLIVTAEKLG
ncbi:MAG: methyltransferase domain-containing protein [Chloroflexi bacterium]|nr:methyltransferase domain-containing protein [Chloroflexota bacterium]